ncbi:MAG: biotin transporter BioY [Luteitalea sp.]|nr:biotin transporter BioY [Luteitalea sp.]
MSNGYAPRAIVVPTLLGRLAGDRASSRALQLGAVLFVTALTAAAAQVTIPFQPVPFTLQPTLVLLGGAALGARLGFASQVLYLMLGVVGLPVFAASPFLPQGAARLLGPTAGFLLAYPFAAFATGWLAERRFDRRYLTSLMAMAAGLAILFIGGLLRLAYVPPAMGLERALEVGVAPFFVADLLKLVIAAAVLPSVWKLVGRLR